MKNILTHPETLEILTKLLHDDIRLEVVDILKNYASLLNLKLPEKFFTFFSHNIMEEYMVVPKEMIFDEVKDKLPDAWTPAEFHDASQQDYFKL